MNDNEIITSRDNAKLKFARLVRDGRETGWIFVEGVRLVRELLESQLEIKTIYISSDLAASLKASEVLKHSTSKRSTPVIVAASLFPSISDTENSQGIIAIARRAVQPVESVFDERVAGGPAVLLYEANNPSNIGAVIRTAEAAGARGVIISTGSADAFSPKSIRASMGSCFRLPIVEGVDFYKAVELAKGSGFVPTAADISGNSSYTRIDWTRPRLLVMGSEAHGLGQEELAQIDEKVAIRMDSPVESLNLAVSAGIILFEAKRQSDETLT